MSSAKSMINHAAFAVIGLVSLGGVGFLIYYFACQGFCSAQELPLILMLFFVLPLLGSIAAAVTIYVTRQLSAWTFPVIAWTTLPLAALIRLLSQFPFVEIAPAAQNTQGTAAAGMLTIIAIVFLLVCLGLITVPILTSVAIWAQNELKKYFIVFGASLMVMLLIVWGVFDAFVSSIIEYMN